MPPEAIELRAQARILRLQLGVEVLGRGEAGRQPGLLLRVGSEEQKLGGGVGDAMLQGFVRAGDGRGGRARSRTARQGVRGRRVDFGAIYLPWPPGRIPVRFKRLLSAVQRSSKLAAHQTEDSPVRRGWVASAAPRRHLYAQHRQHRVRRRNLTKLVNRRGASRSRIGESKASRRR